MRVIFISCFLLINGAAKAQPDSSKVEQYCEVVATEAVLSRKVTISIDYGEARSLWKDNRLRAEDGKVKKFNTIIDALNYLGREGWKLVNAFPFAPGASPAIYHYVFRKEFARADVE